LVLVPLCLVGGELIGISLVWRKYVPRFGWPRPTLKGSRVLGVTLRRTLPIYAMRVAQAPLLSIDGLICGRMSPWKEIGLYTASHRIVAMGVTLGLLFQHAALPGLSRAWSRNQAEGLRVLGSLAVVLILLYVPLTIGITVFAGSLVRILFPPEF